ncbi:hypothetical protein P3T76_007264 [Phytophthora citrophthora]|uniref:Crinkler (CRN) family protein n=1 Tax=Phytophthora citrophthora TaxID=4793 RepID=A0AAD9GNF3_9STRA|nr:hypothetical protein P3T76_007264 [Phytophthora citrophthora]
MVDEFQKVFVEGAVNGQLEVVKFMVEHAAANNCRLGSPFSDTVSRVILAGHVHMAEFLLNLRDVYWDLKKAFIAAVDKDQVPLADRIRGLYGPDLFIHLASSGGVTAVEYLYKNGCNDSELVGQAFIYAAGEAQNGVVKFLAGTGCTAIFDSQRYHERFSFPANALVLYLAGENDGMETKWVKDDANLDALLRGSVRTEYEKMRLSRRLDEDYFGENFESGRKNIHVLVELPKEEANCENPPSKKRRLDRYHIPFVGPLHRDDYGVSFDPIEAFQLIQEGPHQYGKTSVAYHIKDWNASDDNVKCVFFEMHKLDVATEEVFWQRLGARTDTSSRKMCCDYDSFKRLVEDCTLRDGKQLCLIVDRMDHLFANESLAKTFLFALRKWKVAPYFRGFLGIGSYGLVHHHEIFREEKTSSPYNVCEAIEMKPFSVEQMSSFFKLLEPRYVFSQSLQPGVFGSLIRFTGDHGRWTLEWDKWESWLKLDVFATYVKLYNSTCHRHLHSLTGLEWEALKYVLENNGHLGSSSVERYCGIPVRRYPERKLVDPLLRMGLAVERKGVGNLAIVSEMMCRICIEALPEREFGEATHTCDPVLLLSIALRRVNPQAISNHLVVNQRSSELVFHHELYPTIRAILKKRSRSRGIYADVTTPTYPARDDIVITSEIRIAFQLKFNQVRASDIEVAVQQADEYRRQFKIDRMLLINFVPIGHKADEVYGLAEFPMVEVIHVRFAVILRRIFFGINWGDKRIREFLYQMRPG